MKFKEQLENYKYQIDTFLKIYLVEERKRAISIDPSNLKIIDLILEFCLRGGKRIRPVLFIKGYEAVGGKDIGKITHTSICIELLEAELLIHDDIIDRDWMRRGGPSFHRMAGKWKNDDHFGISAAIIAGDMLGSLSHKVIMDSKFKESLKIKALDEFTQAELNCFQGELYDVILEEKSICDESDFFKLIDLKTASYTTQAPLVIGAILGEGTKHQIETLREYGRLLGEAFQITDDLLGTYGTEETIGKPVDSDIKQGKKTLLLIYALKNSSKLDRNFLHHSLGNQRLTKNELERVRKILITTGSVTYSKSKAHSIINRAKQTLEGNNFNPKTCHFLFQLADFVIHREL